MSSITYEKACMLEGFLKKKSPNKFTGYQKRYFMVRDSGKLLAYFTKKPKSGDEPKGVLLIHLISSIEISDETKFIVHYPGKSFILRADNTDTQSLWISGIKILIEKAKEIPAETTSSGNWKDKKLHEEIVEIIKQENELPSPASSLVIESDINIQVMVAKGIWRYFSDASPKILKKHLIYGFLNKRSKGAVKYFQKRWFILISGAPLISTIEEEPLNENILPSWMNVNHIYYFKYSGNEDDSQAQGEIPTRLITIRIKDMTGSRDSGNSFLLDLGTRIFHLNAENQEELNRWVKAIEISKENAQQVTTSLTGKPKFVNKIVQLFDQHGQKGLKSKIGQKFQEKTLKIPDNIEDLKEILSDLTIHTQDMISTIDGCISHKPQRLDIAELYAQIFHKHLCEVLIKIWNSILANISEENLLKLIAWTNSYDSQLNTIGINDQKISNSLSDLSDHFSSLFFERACGTLYECFIESSKGNIDIEINTNNYVVCYSSLCSLIEPLLIEMQTCGNNIFAERVLEVVREIVAAYKNAVTEICERNLSVPLSCIAGLCNDSVLMIERFKSWQTMLKSYLDPAVINKHLQTKGISSDIRTIEQVSKNFFSSSLLDKVYGYFEIPFEQLKMDVLFPQIADELNSIEGYTDKHLMDYVWKKLMEEIIRKYVSCVFKSQSSLKTQSVLLLSETLRSDSEMFFKYFSQKFDKNSVQAELESLKNIFEFLEALPSTISDTCTKVKNTQGEDFTFNVAKFLIELRSDLDKDEKKDCVAKVKAVLDDLKGVKKASFESKETLSLKGTDIEDLIESPGPRTSFNRTSSRKITQIGSFEQMKGYLQKKNKQKLLCWDERFFSIKNDRLYWYKTHKALQPINSTSLMDTSIQDTGENPLRFNLVTPNKVIKLLANTQEDKEKWIKALQKPENTEIEISLINEVTKESLFVDANKKTNKRDLMKLANLIVAYIPRKKNKKDRKEEEKKETVVYKDSKDTDSDEIQDKGFCSCLSFFRRKKKPKNLQEPLIIN